MDDAVNNLEVYKVNYYGLEGLVGEATVTLAGGAEVAPLSAPQDLVLEQMGADELTIGAFYYAAMDASPADTWVVNVTTDGGEPVVDQELAITGDVAELRLVLSDEAWVEGAVLAVSVHVKRSSDDAVSAAVSDSLTIADLSLAEPAGAGVFHDERQLLED